ncbi:MAG: hypothetical protein H7202_01455 [Pedobacter sp.]|nr:hypothetical protein [Pedobacter sp.]
MKNYVLEFLEQRGLSHIFNERDYKYYRLKLTAGKGRNEVNVYYTALNIMDMFIINS